MGDTVGLSVVKVISGGQTGVDTGALRAALAAGLEIGGWCPPDRRHEAGPISDVFPLHATPNERSADAPEIPRSQRTEWNVRDADATLLLVPTPDLDDPGTRWTRQCAARLQKPWRIASPSDPLSPEAIVRWLHEHHVRVLNVAGPSESTCPGIERSTVRCLEQVFQVHQDQDPGKASVSD